jgi:hypothetical protein
MLFTLVIGCRLGLILWLGEEKWRSRAEVVTRDPQFGNGIRFLNLDDEKISRLEKIRDTLPSPKMGDAT